MHSPNPQPSTPVVIEHDRRHFPRYTVHVQIEIHLEGDEVPIRLETTDLSRTGCYVQLLMPLPLAARIHATLWLDNRPIVVRGRVVTRHPQFGNGIMFLDFEADGDQVLKRYLAAIAT
jgi:hypothetical protein